MEGGSRTTGCTRDTRRTRQRQQLRVEQPALPRRNRKDQPKGKNEHAPEGKKEHPKTTPKNPNPPPPPYSRRSVPDRRAEDDKEPPDRWQPRGRRPDDKPDPGNPHPRKPPEPRATPTEDPTRTKRIRRPNGRGRRDGTSESATQPIARPSQLGGSHTEIPGPGGGPDLDPSAASRARPKKTGGRADRREARPPSKSKSFLTRRGPPYGRPYSRGGRHELIFRRAGLDPRPNPATTHHRQRRSGS